MTIEPRDYSTLRRLTRTYWDLQRERIALGNRLSIGNKAVGEFTDPFGKKRPKRQAVIMGDDLEQEIHDGLVGFEKLLSKEMVVQMEVVAPELSAFVERTRGLGAHSMAKLLGQLGHPVIATPARWQNGKAPKGHVCNPLRCKKKAKGVEERHLIVLEPRRRSLGQLWQYCGVGDASKRRRKGMTAEEAMAAGRADIHATLSALIVDKLIMAKNPDYYNQYVIDKDQAKQAHPDWSAARCNNHAKRMMAKQFLADIYDISKEALALEVAA